MRPTPPAAPDAPPATARPWAGSPVVFTLLALTFSWAPWVAVLLTTGDATASTGSLVLWMLGGVGPAAAAFVTAAAGDGRDGVRRLAGDLLHWRVGWWYVLLLAPLPLLAAAVLAAVAVGPAELDLTGLLQWYLLPVLFLNGIVFGGLEEVGWRGYLQPRLQARRTALTASVLVGIVWSVWHAPLFAMAGTTQTSTSIAWFTVQAVALSVVLAWAYNGTGGSVLLAVLLHGAFNAWYGAVVQGLAPTALETVTPYTALLLVAAAALLVWRCGSSNLSGRPRPTWPAVAAERPRA